MKRLATTLFFTFFSFLYILASIGGLKGSIKDAASRSALEFVNISLYDSSGTKLIKGTISDENGLFRFDGLKSGNYLLRISYVGYKTFCLTEDDIDFLCSHTLVVTGLWGRVENQLPQIRARGIPVAFDCADRPEDPVAVKALPYVNYAFFSNDTADDEMLQGILRSVHACGPQLAVATRGERGSMAFDGQNFYRGDIVPCKVVDTMGAGDSFIAGFLYGLMRGRDIPSCMALGTG